VTDEDGVDERRVARETSQTRCGDGPDTREPSGPLVVPPAAFAFLRSHGSARDVGRAHGATFAEQVRASVASCRRRVEEVLGLEWSTARQMARDQRTRLEDLDAELVAEMEGIAEGADLDPLDIVTLHVRTALSRMVERQSDLQPPDPTSDGLECTTIAVLPTATVDGHVLAAQNWDMHASYQPRVVIIEQHIDGRPALMFVTEAGMLFSHGMNEAGLAILGNALHTVLAGSPDRGVPVQITRRRAMRERTVADARLEIERLDRAHAVNHLLVDRGGTAVDLEAVPGEVFAVEPQDGVLVHTNHFLNREARQRKVERAGGVAPDSRRRAERAGSMLTECAPRVSVGDLQAVLRDHHDDPEPICRHHDDAGEPTASSTVSSSVLDLTDGRLWSSPGPPCTSTPTMHPLA
jgi:isopenicillin-N N-acyltransferase like protein